VRRVYFIADADTDGCRAANIVLKSRPSGKARKGQSNGKSDVYTRTIQIDGLPIFYGEARPEKTTPRSSMLNGAVLSGICSTQLCKARRRYTGEPDYPG